MDKLSSRGFYTILLLLILVAFLAAGASGLIFDFIIYAFKNLMF